MLAAAPELVRHALLVGPLAPEEERHLADISLSLYIYIYEYIYIYIYIYNVCISIYLSI